jgi:Double zinc ribbon
MRCPRCRHKNAAGAKFCEECATPLARVCAKCSRPLSPTAKFCPECAHPTGLVPAPPAAQRFERRWDEVADPHSTWWHTLPHRSEPRSNAAM